MAEGRGHARRHPGDEPGRVRDGVPGPGPPRPRRRGDRDGRPRHGGPEVGRRLLESALQHAHGAAGASPGQIGGDYEWDDLGLLHGQVLGSPPFDQPIEGAVARHAIGDSVDTKAAIDTALTTVGMIAALLGIFATGGMAAALAVTGAAAGGGQAIRSIDDYRTLAGLRQARTGDKAHDLVTQDTLDAAEQKAILDSIFAFLDTVGAVRALKELGGSRRSPRSLGQFGTLRPPRRSRSSVPRSRAWARRRRSTRSGASPRRAASSARARPRCGAPRRSRTGWSRNSSMRAPRRSARPGPAKALGQGAGAGLEIMPKAARSPEELLREARAHVAAKTGARRLMTPCGPCAPQAATAQDIAKLVEKAAASAAELSEEWARLGTAEARAGEIHRRTLEFAAMNRLPPPELKLGNGFLSDRTPGPPSSTAGCSARGGVQRGVGVLPQLPGSRADPRRPVRRVRADREGQGRADG